MKSSSKKITIAYVEIADTYKKISKGDYISYLIAEKKREDERTQSLQKKKLR